MYHGTEHNLTFCLAKNHWWGFDIRKKCMGHTVNYLTKRGILISLRALQFNWWALQFNQRALHFNNRAFLINWTAIKFRERSVYKKRAHDFICSAPSLNSMPLIQLKSSVYKNKYRRIVVEIREISNLIREISFFLFHFHVSRAVITPNRKCRLLLV